MDLTKIVSISGKPGLYHRTLKEVFKMIHEKMGDKVDFDFKKASNEQLREKFALVMPDYDEDAVYPSDMKKVFAWYQMLMDKNLLDFTEEPEQAAAQPAEEEAAKE